MTKEDKYEIIFVTEVGRAIKDNKTKKIYYSEFEIIDELQQKNKQLKERIKYLERSIERKDEKAIDNYNDYIGILTNWNKLKDYFKESRKISRAHDNYRAVCFLENCLNTMQEIEGDNNE